LEGIIAKRKFDPYLEHHANWLKIRNRYYSQWIGREELFARERDGSPDDEQLWHVRTLKSDGSSGLAWILAAKLAGAWR
jgi:hypothetical protein